MLGPYFPAQGKIGKIGLIRKKQRKNKKILK